MCHPPVRSSLKTFCHTTANITSVITSDRAFVTCIQGQITDEVYEGKMAEGKVIDHAD